MTLRWGRRSSGGIVKAGAGGWYLHLLAPPSLSYLNPDTGDSASRAGWNLARSRRVVLATHARFRDQREVLRGPAASAAAQGERLRRQGFYNGRETR